MPTLVVPFMSRFAILMSVLMLSACAPLPPQRPAEGAFVDRTLALDGVEHRYQVFVPTRSASGGKPPVILFLHGSGERGNDGVKPTMAGLGPYVRAHAQDFPAIVVFPQAAEDSEWMGANVDMAMTMLDAATREFDGDERRRILTGMSMGGYGTWEMALRHPKRFAALVPVCGAINQHSTRALYVTEVAGKPDPYAAVATQLRDVPIWIFHGAKDDVVLPDDDRLLAKAFAAAGAKDARYTEFPDANHNAWDPAYAQTPALWDWIWAQRRR